MSARSRFDMYLPEIGASVLIFFVWLNLTAGRLLLDVCVNSGLGRLKGGGACFSFSSSSSVLVE